MRNCLITLVLVGQVALAKKKDASPGDNQGPRGLADAKALNDLTVACTTTEADVFVDQEKIGQAPIDLPVPVSNGSHTIRVTKLGYVPYNDVFKAVPGQPVKLSVELIPISGVLHVKTTQKDVRVLVDGKYVGDAPLDIEMEPGPRAIQVSKACYEEFFKNVMAVAGQDIVVDQALAELPPATNPCVVKPPPPPKWYQKKWVWGVVAGVAVVAAGAVVTSVLVLGRDPLSGADTTLTIPALMMGH